MKKLLLLFAVLILAAAVANAEENSSPTQISGGANWIVQSSEGTHRIMVVDVTENGDACILSVDGYTKLIYVGRDATLNGVYIKVFHAYPTHSQLQDNDACEIFIGSSAGKYVITKEMPKPAAVSCTAEGKFVSGNSSCCANLSKISFNETSNFCSNCGDGVCVAPEDPLSCPSDCKPIEKNQTQETPKEATEELTIWRAIWNFFRSLFR